MLLFLFYLMHGLMLLIFIYLPYFCNLMMLHLMLRYDAPLDLERETDAKAPSDGGHYEWIAYDVV